MSLFLTLLVVSVFACGCFLGILPVLRDLGDSGSGSPNEGASGTLGTTLVSTTDTGLALSITHSYVTYTLL